MRVIEASIPATPFYPDLVKKRVPAEWKFHERLIALRKERGLTQQALANLVDKNVIRSVIESIVPRNTFQTAEPRFTQQGGSTR